VGSVRTRVVEVGRLGIVLKSRGGQPFSITFGEILTAERLRKVSGMRLHTRTLDPVQIRARGAALLELETILRGAGVRIVDCWGALITPTLADFEDALDQEPVTVRQSSDNA
jgi:hypothetical protein